MSGTTASADAGLSGRFRAASRAASATLGGLGLVVLLGWALDIGVLKSLHPSLVSMKANTALAFLLVGAALLLEQEPGVTRGRRRAARILAAAAALIGAATLLEYALGLDLGIDQLLAGDAGAIETTSPGRMSLAAALHFTLIGVAVILLDLPHARGRLRAAEGLVVVVGVCAMLSALGYLYGVPEFYELGPHTSLSLHATLGLLIACVAILCARPDHGVMQVIASASPAGALARRVLPAAVLVPAAFGWLRLRAHEGDLVDFDTGLALFTGASIVFFAGLVLWNLRALHRSDSLRLREQSAKRAADLTLRESEARKAAVLEAAVDCIVTMDHTGAIVEFNQAAERTFGHARADVTGKLLADLLIPPGLRDAHRQGLQRYLDGGAPRILGKRIEVSALRSDGTEFPAEVTVVRIRSDGSPMFTGYIRDITERVRSAEALRASEARFRRLVESGLIGIVVASADGAIHDANDAFLKMLGYSRDDLDAGRLRWGDLAPARWPDIERSAREATGATDSASTPEVELRGREGNKVAVLLGVTRLDDVSTIAFVLDLTERKEAEAAISNLRRERAADAVFRALLEAAPEAMVILDQDGRISLVNSEAERVFGYTREEMLGRAVDLLFAGGRFAPDTRALGADLVLRGRRKDGSEFPIEVSSSPIETEDGPLLSSAIRDISQRKEGEERLRRAKDEAEIAMGELEAFSYSVAHDLRAPLRTINGFSSAVLEDWGHRLDGDGRDYLRRIVAGAERMGHLIDALLTLARVSRTELLRESVDLTRLARSVFAHLRAAQPEREVDFVVEDGLAVRGDPHLLRVLLENLLGNAWKFSSRRDLTRIEFGCVHDDDDVYYVRDNGAGFDMRYVNKLFTPFQRLHATSEFAGTGIGLATVQRIVRRHGGRIWAEAAVDQGSTFHFTLAGSSGV
jgi:PAS domain S-box-containing protein